MQTPETIGQHIENGLGKVEHALKATPSQLDRIETEIREVRELVEPFIDRVGALLDGFEAFAQTPMGKMFAKRMEKDAE